MYLIEYIVNPEACMYATLAHWQYTQTRGTGMHYLVAYTDPRGNLATEDWFTSDPIDVDDKDRMAHIQRTIEATEEGPISNLRVFLD